MTKTCYNENIAEISNELFNGNLQARAIFICLPSSHPFVEKEVYLNGKIKIGRTYLPAKQCRDKLFFDSKVLSKNHALIWYDNNNGKFFLKDTKSSNGTFVNGNRLSSALEESEDYEIFSDDVVQFGVEVTETTDSKDIPNVHSGVYTLLKLYHPDGSLAIRPTEKDQIKKCPNVSLRQLNIVHDCLKLSMNRENILRDKLVFLKQQLTNLEEITKKKWDFIIDEDLLISKIETLQNKFESLLNVNNQLKNLDDEEAKLAVLTKEIQALQDQKEDYQYEFKTIVKKTLDDKRIAEAKLKETELKLNSALNEIKHLENWVNKCKSELISADSQNKFLDDELKNYKWENIKLLDEKQLFEKQIAQLKENEIALNEIIKDLKLEIESKQLELKSIGVFEDVINCSKNLNSKQTINNKYIANNDLDHHNNEHISNNTHHNQSEYLNNGKLPNNDQYSNNEIQYNCTDYFNCPINEQSSQKFLELLNDFLTESKNSKKFDENEEILKHALAILVMENRNLIKQLEQQSNLMNSVNSIHSSSINSLNSLNNSLNSTKSSTKFTSSLESNVSIISIIQSSINNQRALIDKENEINTLTKLVNELEDSFNHLKSQYKELEAKAIRKGRRDEEAVRNEVQNVLDSVIEKVETKITQQDFDKTINRLNLIQNEYDKLKMENTKLRKQNDVTTSEVQNLKEELEMVSYQNKMAHLLALIPITVLIVSIILAYLPILQIATGTKEI